LFSPTESLDCEFTLALNNRTGKYFFCQDMMEAASDLIRTCYYWRVPSKTLPSKPISRILGRLALIEVNLRVRHPASYRILPPIFHTRPMLFTDPRECVLYSLKQCDIVLCHDMGPITHPELYADGVNELYLLAFERIKKARPLMLFVSDASRRGFVELYGRDFPLLQVIHIPLREGIANGEEQPLEGIPERFFLTVGSLGTRKNQLRSIRAFEASGLAREGFGYVLCGGPEPGADEVTSAAKGTAGVILPGYVNDMQLRWLYRKAQGFILASLLEGFGLPAAEAICYGQVPLLSAGGALQEVAGDGAILVDPYDISQITAGMQSLARMSTEERGDRLEKLRLSIERFSVEAATGTWRSALSLALKSWRQQSS
jgi:glycosyltransferase involved in cell wall biosynthesis